VSGVSGWSGCAIMKETIDLGRYPIHRRQTEAHTRLVETSRAQLREEGFVSLPNFVNRDVVDRVTAAIVQLERDGIGFYSRDSHNVFLEEHKVSNQSSSNDLHPRFIEMKSSKLILNACDLAESPSIALAHLDKLFSSSLVIDFISEVLETKVYPSVDQYGKYYANIYNESDGLSWHLDRSQLSISLTLRPSLSGGEFEYAPNSREIVERWGEMPHDVAAALQAQRVELRVPKLTIGDLYIFRGANSLHRVSPVTEGKRVNIIFTYNSEPNVKLNGYTLQKFFGVQSTRRGSCAV